MKMKDAREIISAVDDEEKGFMVTFEWVKGGMLHSDHFPDKHAGEKLIDTETEAWDLASKFAAKTLGKAVNIYVTKGDFTPVERYAARMIENRS